MIEHELVWAFDLGKGSIGEAVRNGNVFRHKTPPQFQFHQNKTGEDCPRRLCLRNAFEPVSRAWRGERTVCVI